MAHTAELTRRVVREGRTVSVRFIGVAKVVTPEPAARPASSAGFKPTYSDELVAAAKALHQVGLQPTAIATLLKIPHAHESVKWWTRELCRKRVPMSEALYETIMKAIEQSIAGHVNADGVADGSHRGR
jgi:hypothetical protein